MREGEEGVPDEARMGKMSEVKRNGAKWLMAM